MTEDEVCYCCTVHYLYTYTRSGRYNRNSIIIIIIILNRNREIASLARSLAHKNCQNINPINAKNVNPVLAAAVAEAALPLPDSELFPCPLALPLTVASLPMPNGSPWYPNVRFCGIDLSRHRSVSSFFFFLSFFSFFFFPFFQVGIIRTCCSMNRQQY